jgi:hypothetical protein
MNIELTREDLNLLKIMLNKELGDTRVENQACRQPGL